jgi:hypothetical protein
LHGLGHWSTDCNGQRTPPPDGGRFGYAQWCR